MTCVSPVTTPDRGHHTFCEPDIKVLGTQFRGCLSGCQLSLVFPIQGCVAVISLARGGVLGEAGKCRVVLSTEEWDTRKGLSQTEWMGSTEAQKSLVIDD